MPSVKTHQTRSLTARTPFNVHASTIESTQYQPQGVELFTLPKITDPRGNLTALESLISVPFDIRRVFYLYDVPGGETRGGHAHRQLHQIIIAASGSFDVLVDNGHDRSHFSLNRAYLGLYIPPLTWQQLVNFSSGSVCLVLASDLYQEQDYIRNYEEFLQIVGGRPHDPVS